MVCADVKTHALGAVTNDFEQVVGLQYPKYLGKNILNINDKYLHKYYSLQNASHVLYYYKDVHLTTNSVCPKGQLYKNWTFFLYFILFYFFAIKAGYLQFLFIKKLLSYLTTDL